jgi:hypothetical protein
MGRDAQNQPALRAMRSALLVVSLTVGALYALKGDVSPPHGNPLVYALAISWLISVAVTLLISAIFRVNGKLFSLARWEKEGEIYNRASVRAFRLVLLHSPLGWINPHLRLGASRTDCERLLTEMNVAEGVHWCTCVLSTTLAITYVIGDYDVYGYVILLVRIPFDLFPIMLQRVNRGRVSRVLSRQPGMPVEGDE